MGSHAPSVARGDDDDRSTLFGNHAQGLGIGERNGLSPAQAGRTDALRDALMDLPRRLRLVQDSTTGEIRQLDDRQEFTNARGATAVQAEVPALPIDRLGDPAFLAEHGLKYACVAGSMANGIASVEIVEAMARAGMLGFFGAAGLAPVAVETAIDRLSKNLGDLPFGANLIHSPQEPALESKIVDLYLRKGVRLVEASAFLDLTLPIVRYRVTGISRDSQGNIVAPNKVMAKASRVEVAAKFMKPPPAASLRELVARGEITAEQAELARHVPMAQDVTAEADSGGHTDNRPAITLLPTFAALRDRIQSEQGYEVPLRVGAAGGIATPGSVAAALAMGAAYVMTGSVNQGCVESGSSDAVRSLLAQAQQADTMMAPAADMFEMGVKLQVLKRGTMFPMRAAKLYDLYRTRSSLDDIPLDERISLEKTIFRASLGEIWELTRAFFLERDPNQVERAARDPKHKMALVFRWYLGHSSRWANAGESTRTLDYQVWCGPSMGAFNEWSKGTFLETAERRQVATVSLNLLYGAAVLTRASIARFQGVRLASGFPRFLPLTSSELASRLNP